MVRNSSRDQPRNWVIAGLTSRTARVASSTTISAYGATVSQGNNTLSADVILLTSPQRPVLVGGGLRGFGISQGLSRALAGVNG